MSLPLEDSPSVLMLVPKEAMGGLRGWSSTSQEKHSQQKHNQPELCSSPSRLCSSYKINSHGLSHPACGILLQQMNTALQTLNIGIAWLAQSGEHRTLISLS